MENLAFMKKLIGIGNALTDVLVLIESDQALENLGIPKGSMQLIDEFKHADISNYTSNLSPKLETGGSAANTINTAAMLGLPCGFIGKIGNDHYGEFFTQRMKQGLINFNLLHSNLPSGCANTFISPNGERSFGTYLGAASDLQAEELTLEMFKGYDMIHIEGYLISNEPLFRRILTLSKQAGLVISLDMASYNVVEAFLPILKDLVPAYVDILFANEEEAKAYTGLEPEEALIQIAQQCAIAIVKTGPKGSYIRSEGHSYHIPVYKAVRRDTTGAGDLYAAGFLYAVARGFALDDCGRVGTMLSSSIIEVIGTRLPDRKWEEIKAFCQKIESKNNRS